MSTLGDVAAQLHVVLGRISDTRQCLYHALTEIEGATQLLSHTWHGSADPVTEHTIAGLFQAQQVLAERHRALDRAAATVRSYLDRLGVEPRSSVPLNTSSAPPASTGAGDHHPAAVVGTWRGKSAAEHARDNGRMIGRPPARPKRHPIREVRSLDELDTLFTALSPGSEKLDKPTYAGHMLLYPDGTTIGYRVKSKTTVEPTIDIKTPDGWSLKIHVNTQGWD